MIDHPTHGYAVDVCMLYAKTDDAAGEHVHETIAFLRGGRLSGFLDAKRTPFYFTKKLKDVPHIDEEGRAVRVPQWIIELEAPVDVTALLRESEDEETAIVNAQVASQILEGPGGACDARFEADATQSVAAQPAKDGPNEIEAQANGGQTTSTRQTLHDRPAAAAGTSARPSQTTDHAPAARLNGSPEPGTGNRCRTFNRAIQRPCAAAPAFLPG